MKILFVSLLLLLVSGCGDSNKAVIRGPYNRGEAETFASRVALLAYNQGTYRGIKNTNSMWPILDSNAFVVYDQQWLRVRPGQAVVRVDEDGRTLHLVVREGPVAGTWVMRGYNNNEIDSKLLTINNYGGTLIAVVYFDEDA